MKKKILHLGNIANNAYNFSKVLNDNGYDSDVICWDTYHIMSSPEWEECDFEQSPKNQFFPDWNTVGVGGYRHPRWFIQGPRKYAVNYMIAKNESRVFKSHFHRFQCYFFRLMLVKQLHLVFVFFNPKSAAPIEKNIHNAINLMAKIDSWTVRLMVAMGIIIWPFFLFFTKILSSGTRYTQFAWQKYSKIIENRQKTSASRAFNSRIDQLIENFNAGNPPTKILRNDLVPYFSRIDSFVRLFSAYDLIIGYSTDGIYPLLAGFKYVCLEHGTIRNIPFTDDMQGRLCALTYKNAQHTFITNCDNNIAAKRLGLKNFSFIPHPMNERWVKEARQNLPPKKADELVIFHPPRHHWDENLRDSNWDKGNDLLLRAVARLIFEDQLKIKLILVNFGIHVNKSKTLISTLCLTDYVTWIEPVPHRKMLSIIQSSDIVADQFSIPTFGGIPPKALLCSVPVLTSFDEPMHQWCFPEMPPFIECTSNLNAIYESLKSVGTDRQKLHDRSRKSLDWYVKYYSNAALLKTFHEIGI